MLRDFLGERLWIICAAACQVQLRDHDIAGEISVAVGKADILALQGDRFTGAADAVNGGDDVAQLCAITPRIGANSAANGSRNTRQGRRGR